MPKKLTDEIHNIPLIDTNDSKEQGHEQGQENPFLQYNNRTFQSYVKNNFADRSPHVVEAPNTRLKQFISRIDLTKDYERKIMTIVRFKTRNYASTDKRKPEKEFLVYQEEWIGKNWLGEKLRCHENFEGVYREVDSAPEVKWNDNVGRSEVVGKVMTGSHEVYYILYNKEKVDEIIAKSDSDKTEIKYCVKYEGRRDYFTYDEFVNYSWEQLVDVLLYDGGAVAARADRALQNRGKVLTANNLKFKPS